MRHKAKFVDSSAGRRLRFGAFHPTRFVSAAQGDAEVTNARSVGITIGLLALALLTESCRPAAPRAAEQTAVRVASLAPNLTEIVCAIGAADLLVGRTSACRYPSEVVTNVPVIGGFGSPSLERLVQVQASLVLEVDLEDESLGRRIEQMGIQRHRLPCRRLDDIPKAIEEVGTLLGRREAASRVAEGFVSRVIALRASIAAATNRPLVFVEIWSDPLYTAGRNSFISDLIALAGGRNLGDEVTEKDYFPVSSEWVVARDPEVVICLSMGSAAAVTEAVRKRAGWEQVRAVKNGRIYASSRSDVLTAPGPRCLDGVEELRGFICGEAMP